SAAEQERHGNTRVGSVGVARRVHITWLFDPQITWSVDGLSADPAHRHISFEHVDQGQTTVRVLWSPGTGIEPEHRRGCLVEGAPGPGDRDALRLIRRRR